MLSPRPYSDHKCQFRRRDNSKMITIPNIVVQSLSHVQLFVTLWTAAHQASLSFSVSQSLLRLMSIESMMLSNHLILCHPLLLPSVFPSIKVFFKCSSHQVAQVSEFHLRHPSFALIFRDDCLYD